MSIEQSHRYTAPQGSPMERPTRVRWTMFALVFVIVIVNFIDRASLSVAMPMIAGEFDLSPGMQGLILSSFFWTYALAQIPGGWLLDRAGPRRVIAASTGLWGVFQALAGAAVGGVSLLAARLGLGIAEAPMFPAGAKLNAAWLSPRERARGATFLDCGGPLGAAFGGLVIAGLITALNSWRAAFVVAGIGTVALGLAAYRFLRDTPAQHPRVNAAELAYVHRHRDASQNEDDATGPGFAGYLRRRSMWGILVGRLGWTLIFFGLLTWGPAYLAHARGLDIKGIGFATFLIFGAGAVGALVGGAIADHFVNRGTPRSRVLRSMLGVSALAAIAAFLLLREARDAGTTVALLSGAVFFVMWGSLYWTFPAVLAPEGRAGLVGGVMNFAGSCGGIAAPIIIGALVQVLGSYDVVIGFFVASAIVYLVGSWAIDFTHRLDGAPVESVRG
jgi:ACS family D-galactonate transporter-like MFS transporter